MFTLAIVKPDAVAARNTGKIIAYLEAEGFQIRAAQLVTLTQARAESFYDVHRERPFFQPLVAFMTSGPALAIALERDNAVAHLRRTMGATDSRKAEPGTVRNLFGTDIERNAIHGSDSAENAAGEIAFFFAQSELI